MSHRDNYAINPSIPHINTKSTIQNKTKQQKIPFKIHFIWTYNFFFGILKPFDPLMISCRYNK